MAKKRLPESCKKKLEHIAFTLNICDLATGGLLESTIKTPENYHRLRFYSDEIADEPFIVIKGLQEYWDQKWDLQKTELEFIFSGKNQKRHFKKDIPFRGKRVKMYALEFICYQILQFLEENV